MTYTTTPPSVPGWYWVRSSNVEPCVAAFYLYDGRLFNDLVPGWWDSKGEAYEYAGPIPEPEEQK